MLAEEVGGTSAMIMWELNCDNRFERYMEQSEEESVINRQIKLCDIIGEISEMLESAVDIWDGEWLDVCTKVADLILEAPLDELKSEPIFKKVKPMIAIPNKEK